MPRSQESVSLSPRTDRVKGGSAGTDNSMGGEYECDLCGEVFSDPGSLGGHKRAHQISVSSDELIEELKRLGSELGRPPKSSDVVGDGEYSSQTYRTRFGSLGEARAEAGFEKYPYSNPEYAKSDILQAIQELSDRLGRPPTTAEMEDDGNVSMTAVQNRFDTWSDAVGAAGLDTAEIPDGGDKLAYTKTEVLCRLMDLADKKGRPPTANEIKGSDTLSMKPIYRVFESYPDAVRAAGLDPEDMLDIWDSRGRISPEEVVEEIQAVAGQMGEPPGRSEFNEHSDISYSSAYTQFGTWGNALRAAGFEPEKRWSVTSGELLEDIRELSDRLGRAPTYDEMTELGEFSPASCESHFGKWNAAVREAGLNPVGTGLEGALNPNWTGGHDSRERYGSGWTEDLRQRVRERDGLVCQDPGCEMTQEQHLEAYGRSLHVHHIRDPERFNDSSEAHDPNNLITLCHFHHLSKWELLQPLAPDTAGRFRS